MKANILIVEDEEELTLLLRYNLGRAMGSRRSHAATKPTCCSRSARPTS